MYLNLPVVNPLMKRYFARKDLLSAIKTDLSNISKEFAEILPEKIEILETKGKTFVFVDGEAVIFESEKGYFPTVRGALRIKGDKRSVTVDRGAIPYIVNGADVMRPGVVAYDRDIKTGDLVIVREETHGKAIAIGVSLCDGNDFASKSTGKCAKNVQFVGDDVWNLA